MPLDPVQLAAWATTLISYGQASLNKFPGDLMPADVKTAAAGMLTTCQAYINSPQWTTLIAFLNNPS